MQERIFTICDTLSQAGINPTAEKVRAELGGGSFSTISPIIKKWRENGRKDDFLPQAIPPEALNAVHQATAIIWKLATDHQAQAINAVRQECTRIEQEAIAERDEALREIAFLEQTLTTHEEQITRLLAKDTARANEANSLDLQIHKQQLALDSTVNQNIELKAEVRELREKTSIAQNEASRLAGMLEAFKNPVTLHEAPTEKVTPTVKEPKPSTPKKTTTTAAKRKPAAEK
jgi:hypothetical protein